MIFGQRGSAPIGFVFAAPIGLLLLLSSFEMSQLLWERALATHELRAAIQQAARSPARSAAIFGQFLDAQQPVPVASFLTTSRKAESSFLIATIEFEHDFLGYIPVRYQIEAIEVIEN